MNFFSFTSLLLTTLCLLGGGCASPQTTTSLSPPLDNLDQRAKKLTFGLYVTPDPAQNPIDPPERFTGYHAALDLEILDGEEEKDVPVYSICTGRLVYRNENVEGYGGVLVQSCSMQDQEVTVLYGHLDPGSFQHSIYQSVEQGAVIARLGDHGSAETSFTRKHLHLSIHKGGEIELRGYVQTKEELDDFIDPAPLLGQD